MEATVQLNVDTGYGVCMSRSSRPSLDEIDHVIVGILAQNPRTPYSEIADVLTTKGHELSAEAIRKRVGKIFDATSMFFLLSPEQHSWEIVRVGVKVDTEPGARAAVYDRLADQDLWFVARGFGSLDFYVVGTATSNEAVEALLTAIRELEHVVAVEYIVETSRVTNIENYLPDYESGT